MYRILTAEQMKNADNFTINTLGISQQTLVERAGFAVAEEIFKRFKGGRVLVCKGKGNNGKDGQVIENLLSKKHGFNVCGINIDNGFFKLFEKKYDIIVDCIFGTGLNKNVEGKYKTAIDLINNSGAFVVSCDIASGLNANTGMPMGCAVKANLTIAIGEYKLGHFLNDGKDYSGNVILKDIGISVWGDDFIKSLSSEDVKKLFANRKHNSHKGSYPKSLIIGGSKKYVGSAYLSYLALVGLKTGLGYSCLAIPNCIYNNVALINPEIILFSLDDDGENVVFNKDALEKFLSFDSISIGMGMGSSKAVYDIIEYLLNNYEGKLIIDADGLNVLAKYGLDILQNKKCKTILTPHIKEFSRLSNYTLNDILNNGIDIARDFAKKYNVILLLKSSTSIITDGEETYINKTGCSALAKAGSGDVLSGILAGLVARDEETLYLVATSSYLLGTTSEFASKNQNDYTVTATDIIKELPNAINSL